MQSLCHRTISCRTKAGGDQYGQNLRSASYTPNSLNQYTSRTVPGGFDMVGVANKDATVRVDGNDVQYRRGEYWRQYVSVDNAGVPVWRSVSVTTTGGGTTTGSVFVPKASEEFVFDLDGNLTSDGRWTYVWDAENRLTQMVANTTVGPQQRIDYEYDWKGRRIGKKVWDNTLGTGNPSLTRKFLYDGWNLIAELDGNNALVRSYVWGLDVSGSFQGAGGVGGLLMVKDAANGTHFAAYDLNGNVMGLVNAANGTISAQYEYGPFGEVIRMTGAMAKLNPFRFSTKYQDDETDLLYYGYRYYNASTGRWLSSDPIGERGGLNLYGFVNNDSINGFDGLGNEAEGYIKTKKNGKTQLVRPNTKIKVTKCNILILIGHGHLMPSEIEGESCSYGAAYGCNTGGGSIEVEEGSGDYFSVPAVTTPGIPGAPKAPTKEIDDTELIKLANKAFEAAKTSGVKKLCKKKCGCTSVSITTQFLSTPKEVAENNENQQAVNAVVAANQATIKCH